MASSFSQWFMCTFIALLLLVTQRGSATSPAVNITCPKIHVDPSGRGNFTTIQAAINSVPSYNTNWICIHIKEGVYREQVKIPYGTSFIYLRGAGRGKPQVVWDAHENIATSATFTCQADDVIVENLTFMNSYNYPLNGSGHNRTQAVAARIEGDRLEFHKCGFIGLQDTLWDVQGRHYFKSCTIQGAVDFIFGSGQSLYEKCKIAVVAGALNGTPGYITAQGRSMANETNGFVFKNCSIIGNGRTYLGRPWRDYARVIFYNTYMSDIIVPEGYDAWFSFNTTETLTFEEIGCRGLGSDTSKRVSWVNKLNTVKLNQLVNDLSYTGADGVWLQLSRY